MDDISSEIGAIFRRHLGDKDAFFVEDIVAIGALLRRCLNWPDRARLTAYYFQHTMVKLLGEDKAYRIFDQYFAFSMQSFAARTPVSSALFSIHDDKIIDRPPPLGHIDPIKLKPDMASLMTTLGNRVHDHAARFGNPTETIMLLLHSFGIAVGPAFLEGFAYLVMSSFDRPLPRYLEAYASRGKRGKCGKRK